MCINMYKNAVTISEIFIKTVIYKMIIKILKIRTRILLYINANVIGIAAKIIIKYLRIEKDARQIEENIVMNSIYDLLLNFRENWFSNIYNIGIDNNSIFIIRSPKST